jgi:hypothetical protein
VAAYFPRRTPDMSFLMSEVAPDQRWGMGQANLGGATLSFKVGGDPAIATLTSFDSQP